MLPTATVVFREILEIALVLTIVIAATRGLKSRGLFITSGLILGAAGAGIIALFTDVISEAIDGMGQEIFNAAIMFSAVILLSWTVVWMKKHGRHLAQRLKQIGQEVIEGEKTPVALIAVVALATFREGAEIVLFTYGMLASEQFTLASILSGALLGAGGGLVVGLFFYFGLLKAAKQHLLTVTSWMLIFLTAGMATTGANFLIAADVLPALTPQLWDTSHIISGHSLTGEILGVLIGYTPRPSGMELLFYLAVLCSVGFLYLKMGRNTQAQPLQATA